MKRVISMMALCGQALVSVPPEQAVWRAVIDGDVRRVRGAQELEQWDEYGNTMLGLAAFMGNEKVVKHLLAQGADVDIRDRAEWTPFMHAILQEHYGVATMLLERYGADVDAYNADGYSALDLALCSGQDEAVQFLWCYGASVFSLRGVRNPDGSIPVPTKWCCDDLLEQEIRQWYCLIDKLFYAVCFGFVNEVKELLDCGISVEVRNKNSIPLLIKAAAHNREDMIQFLVERGAQIDAHDGGGRTALHHTVPYGNIEAAAALLSAGASAIVRSNNGKTPCDFAHTCYENEHGKTTRCSDVQLMNRCVTLMEMFEKAEQNERESNKQ